jgi:hypothetical protein
MTRTDSSPRSFYAVARYLGRHLRRNAFVHALVGYEAYALLVTAGLLALVTFTGIDAPGLLIGGGPSLAAVLAALWRAAREDVSGARVFRDADEVYGYRYLLPTAYEIHCAEGAAGEPDMNDGAVDDGAHRRSPIRRTVLESGYRHIQYLRAETVYPMGTPRRLFLLPLGALASLVILVAAQGIDRPDAPNPWAGYIEDLRQRSDAISRRAEALDDEEGARLAQQLDALSDTLETRPEEKDLEERLREIIPQLEDHMRRLSASDLVADGAGRSGGATGEAENSAALRARRVEEELGEGLDLPPARRGGRSSDGGGGGRPLSGADGAGAEGGQRGSDTERNETRGEAGDDAGGAEPGDAEPAPEGTDPPSSGESGAVTGLGEELEDAREQLERLSQRLRSPPTSGGSAAEDDGELEMDGGNEEESGNGSGGSAVTRRDGSGSAAGAQGQGGSSTAEGTSSTPGIGDAPDLGEEPSERLGDVIRRMRELPTGEEDGSFTELFSRETPGQPRSEVPETAVNPAFRRRVETAVNRSGVPADLRGYVRDYFLRIATATSEEQEQEQEQEQ